MTRRLPVLLLRSALRLVLSALLVLTALLLIPAPASAHPLGNFTTNTSAAVLPADPVSEVRYVLDLAEIPTQQTRGAITAAGGEEAWAAQECARIAAAQSLVVDGRSAALRTTGAVITFPAGEAGLSTLRLTCALEADTPDLATPTNITYADGHVAGRTGWREVIAAPNGSTILDADVPAASPTDQLRTYPEAAVSTITTATLTLDPSQGDPVPTALLDDEVAPVAEAAGLLERVMASYTALVSRQTLTPAFVLLAVVLSIALGTAHAVAPGHGKTVIAAYLLGEGGQARQAVALGGTVAVTHTIGVLLLGVVVQTSTALAPESLYPILGVVGGVLFTLLGVLLLRRALTGHGHDHDHPHGHDHDHDHPHGHDHGQGDVHAHDHGDHTHPEPAVVAVPDGDILVRTPVPAVTPTATPATTPAPAATPRRTAPTWRMLVLPGLAGGMVPSPSALVVLLGGIALGRTWFGILLVVFYGVGMALALVGAGYLLHRIRFRVIDRLEGPTWGRVSAALPLVTSTLIVLGGLVIIGRSLLTA